MRASGECKPERFLQITGCICQPVIRPQKHLGHIRLNIVAGDILPELLFLDVGALEAQQSYFLERHLSVDGKIRLDIAARGFAGHIADFDLIQPVLGHLNRPLGISVIGDHRTAFAGTPVIRFHRRIFGTCGGNAPISAIVRLCRRKRGVRGRIGSIRSGRNRFPGSLQRFTRRLFRRQRHRRSGKEQANRHEQ